MKGFKRSYYRAIVTMALGTLLLVMSACSDDGGGPSTRDLLIGEWELERINGNRDIGGSFTSEFEADGDYTESFFIEGVGNGSIDGEWELDDQMIEIEFDNGDREWEIIEISPDELIVEFENGDEWEFEKDR